MDRAPRVITDAERLTWLAQRVTYLEHKDAQGNHCHQQKVGGWWPQAEDDVSESDPDLHGLGLIEYVDEMIVRNA